MKTVLYTRGRLQLDENRKRGLELGFATTLCRRFSPLISSSAFVKYYRRRGYPVVLSTVRAITLLQHRSYSLEKGVGTPPIRVHARIREHDSSMLFGRVMPVDDEEVARKREKTVPVRYV